MRLLVVGLTTQRPCGVRTHADVMEPAFAALGVSTEVVWWDRDPSRPARDDLAAARAWARRIAAAERPDAVLWHYSVFSYGRRGVPVFAPLVARALPAPAIAFLHEYELSPWRQWGARGAAFVAAQRPFARAVLAASAAAVVTTRPRLAQLEGARWAPRRPLRFAPVPATVPGLHAAGRAAAGGGPAGPLRVGVFSFGAALYEAELTGAALRLAGDAELHLIGAPGAEGAAADRWRAAAAGVPLRFTGRLDDAALAAALASMDVLLFPETGPAARRSTVAAALAVGAPTVMLAGAGADWEDPAREGAMLLAGRTPEALAATLRRAAADDGLPARARAFYARRQSPEVLARELVDMAGAVAR